MKSSREEFLHRVREAVKAGNRPGATGRIGPRGRTGYQGVGSDSVQRFQEQFRGAGGIFHLVANGDSCVQKVLELIQSKAVQRVMLGEGRPIDQLNLASPLREAGIAIRSVDKLESESCREAFFAADMGISGVDFLVAETGSIVLHSGPDQPRSLSLLPPVHIAIAERDQLVNDLFDLFPSSQHDGALHLPSCISIITGPSKTGDIELRLVTGVHGPGEIHLLLIDR